MTVTPEEFILEHAKTPYDPVKRREYYLKTRELKGRTPGAAVTPTGLRPAPGTRPAAKRVTTRTVALKKPPVTIMEQRRKQRRKEINARVKAMNVRLDKLRTVLRQLVEEAQRRSGVDVKKDTPAKKAEPAGSTKKLTAAEKREAAKRSKESYEKNKEKTPLSKQEKQLQREIKEVKRKIEQARKDLKASVARAKKQTTEKKPAATSRRKS
jgi:hypothetical protein